MTKDNLKLLDEDEHRRAEFEEMHEVTLEFCKKHGLTLDCATSDVSLYIEDNYGGYICLE